MPKAKNLNFDIIPEGELTARCELSVDIDERGSIRQVYVGGIKYQAQESVLAFIEMILGQAYLIDQANDDDPEYRSYLKTLRGSVN